MVIRLYTPILTGGIPMNALAESHITPMDFSPILNSDLAESTKIKYTRQIERYLNSGASLADTERLFAWANNLGPSSRLQFKAALTILTRGLELDLKSKATPENVNAIQAALFRLEAVNGSVTTKSTNPKKPANWLTRYQVEHLYRILAQEPAPIKRQRNILLAKLLFKLGIRRSELIQITFSDVSQRPRKGELCWGVQICGKGDKDRFLWLDDETVKLIQDWHQVAGDGYIIRKVRRGDLLSPDQMNPNSVRYLVKKFGAAIGVPLLSAHDTRRTAADLLHQAGVPIERISKFLGHSSVDITMRYLDLGNGTDLIAGIFIP